MINYDTSNYSVIAFPTNSENPLQAILGVKIPNLLEKALSNQRLSLPSPNIVVYDVC